MLQKLYKAVIIDCEVTKVMTWWDSLKMIGSLRFTLKRFPPCLPAGRCKVFSPSLSEFLAFLEVMLLTLCAMLYAPCEIRGGDEDQIEY
jgi:hypothetical protein